MNLDKLMRDFVEMSRLRSPTLQRIFGRANARGAGNLRWVAALRDPPVATGVPS